MKTMPTEDDCYGRGGIRADGRKLHPFHLFQVKQPKESKSDWDIYKLPVRTVSADEAFRPWTRPFAAWLRHEPEMTTLELGNKESWSE